MSEKNEIFVSDQTDEVDQDKVARCGTMLLYAGLIRPVADEQLYERLNDGSESPRFI